MRKYILLCLTLIPLFLGTTSSTSFASDTKDPDVVSDVDLQRYSGKWFEIAHKETFFQRFCHRSTAEYGLLESGGISVLNTCIRNDKVFSTIKGVARVVEAPAKLEVDFGFFRKGDYWIIGLDPQYNWAVVSGPQKKSLFILARTAPMDPQVLEEILSDLRSKNFDLSDLVFDQY